MQGVWAYMMGEIHVRFKEKEYHVARRFILVLGKLDLA